MVCKDREYKKNNKCLPVSILCDEFSKTTGDCITCIDFRYYVLNGVCLLKGDTTPSKPDTTPSKPDTTPQPPRSCLGNEYLSPAGICKPIPANCPEFDAKAEACTKCAWSYYINDEKGCSLIQCSFGKVVDIHGTDCIDKPPFCKDYNSKLGQCTSCTDILHTLISGVCVEVKSTGNGNSCYERQAKG